MPLAGLHLENFVSEDLGNTSIQLLQEVTGSWWQNRRTRLFRREKNAGVWLN